MFGLVGALVADASAQAAKKPNIVFIMGDDIGMWNIGAYHRGMMAGRTPHLDKLAKEGMLFTDYYAEASCTAGRANFITGELPIRTGMTTVGQAGAKIGLPAEACTIATALKAQGYATGQFGKNHLGDRNEFLPTVHGFDEFFGYLYHLDAMEDPAHPNYPQELLNVVGPRNMVHSWATDTDDSDRDAALGQDRQTEDRGRRHALSRNGWRPWTTKSRDLAVEVHGQGQEGRQAVLLSGSTRRACTSSRTSRRNMKRCATRRMAGRNRKPAWPSSMTTSARCCRSSRTWARTTTPSSSSPPTTAPKLFTWPDGGTTPFAQCKGTVMEGGFRVPCILRWPGKVPADTVQNGIFSGLDWFPTFLAAAGNPNITDQLLKGVKLGDRTYKNHLDGYNQMDADHRQRSVRASRNLLLRRKHRRRGAH